jgi:hypothetical protein
MHATRYELKYCERCGSLRLRRTASGKTYCQPCEQTLFHPPLPGPARQSPSPHPSPAQAGPPALSAQGQPALSHGRLQ